MLPRYGLTGQGHGYVTGGAPPVIMTCRSSLFLTFFPSRCREWSKYSKMSFRRCLSSHFKDKCESVGHEVGSVAMEYAGIEVLLGCKMGHTGDGCLPQRPIIGPFREDSLDGRVMDDWVAMGICRYGQALPLHPRIENPQDAMPDAK